LPDSDVISLPSLHTFATSTKKIMEFLTPFTHIAKSKRKRSNDEIWEVAMPGYFELAYSDLGNFTMVAGTVVTAALGYILALVVVVSEMAERRSGSRLSVFKI
jgi:hypothetical protein